MIRIRKIPDDEKNDSSGKSHFGAPTKLSL
jgi:hypothetical protein